ncbi:MAG TPA: hypothetical protein DEP84_03825 [Chloroflexi bacterium]|nr:hypothetical protein [Chloroflexota bacterium]
MFQDLDATLQAMLNDPAAPTELRNADVSFETPDKNFTPAQVTVNLFLYEVKENRELRDPVPIFERVGGILVRRPPPLRVDCSYVVTAWSNQVGAAKTAEEHLLLSQTLAWLSRFPTIPAAYFQGSMVDQPFPPPLWIAQMDANKNSVGEFWSALGISPKSAFYVTATIAMDLDIQVEAGPPVVTKELILKDKEVPGAEERVYQIGGTVRDAGTLTPITDAQVTLVEMGRTAVTGEAGQFTFLGLGAGNYTLRTTASGFTTTDTAIVVPATALNAYDVNLTP